MTRPRRGPRRPVRSQPGVPTPAPVRLAGLFVFIAGTANLPQLAAEAPLPVFLAGGIVTGIGLLVACG